jgi:Co/Zn/Cd efflux system component
LGRRSTVSDDLQESPPADDDWRYRTDGLPRLFAIVGVVAGFALLIVPGVLALRSYRRWQDGATFQPSFAWVMGILAVWGLIIGALLLFTDLLGLAILLAVVGPLTSIVLALKT